MNLGLPRVTNPNLNDLRRARQSYAVNENLVASHPEIYRINLDQYENTRMPTRGENDTQKYTNDDLPSYEEIFISSKDQNKE